MRDDDVSHYTNSDVLLEEAASYGNMELQKFLSPQDPLLSYTAWARLNLGSNLHIHLRFCSD